MFDNHITMSLNRCFLKQPCPLLRISLEPLIYKLSACFALTPKYQKVMSITNSQSLLKLMSLKSVIPSNHLSLCSPLLLLPSVFLSMRVFSSELALHI